MAESSGQFNALDLTFYNIKINMHALAFLNCMKNDNNKLSTISNVQIAKYKFKAEEHGPLKR